jgi:hypothetical protein
MESIQPLQNFICRAESSNAAGQKCEGSSESGQTQLLFGASNDPGACLGEAFPSSRKGAQLIFSAQCGKTAQRRPAALETQPTSTRKQAMTAIIDIAGREILDSRGNPTVEVDVHPRRRIVRPRGRAIGCIDRRA